MASQTRVIINLSDQRASLVQQGRITLVSPIASGKTGWSTPRVTSAFSTRISIIGFGASGLSLTLTEEWSTQMRLPAAMYPGAAIIDPRRCRTSWNSARRLGCTLVTFQDIPRPTDACGCREISLPCFRAGANWNASHGGLQHAQPGSRPKGPSNFDHRFICVGSALMEVADQGEVCRGH
jgi:hypothetical protein